MTGTENLMWIVCIGNTGVTVLDLASGHPILASVAAFAAGVCLSIALWEAVERKRRAGKKPAPAHEHVWRSPGCPIRLRKPNLTALAQEALERGWTDNLDVLAFLVEDGLISGAFRMDGGIRVEFSIEDLKVALRERIEVR